MSYTRLIQQFKDDPIECPKCFNDEQLSVNLKKVLNGMVVRKCGCGHEWADSLTAKEWGKHKRLEGNKMTGNVNQHKKKQPSKTDLGER